MHYLTGPSKRHTLGRSSCCEAARGRERGTGEDEKQIKVDWLVGGKERRKQAQ